MNTVISHCLYTARQRPFLTPSPFLWCLVYFILYRKVPVLSPPDSLPLLVSLNSKLILMLKRKSWAYGKLLVSSALISVTGP